MSSNKPAITRKRDHLSCVECRRKKLKCDRELPCSTCVKRDGASGCVYQRSTTIFEAERDRRRKAEGRLEHLEQLVQQLSKSSQQDDAVTNRGWPTPPPAPLSEGLMTLPGASAEANSVFTGATHWSAMLEDIEELKSAISVPVISKDDDGHHVDDTAILFGAGPSLTFEEVLTQYLPSRQEADRLIASYFRATALKAPFLHHGHFQRLYTTFWAAPLASPPLWVSILFSVMHAAATSCGASAAGDNRYASAAAHCLVVGKHYQPKRHAVEALVLYAQTKCFTQLDVSPDLGSIVGMAVRTALRMGFHREPARASVTPFEREMRRRTWSVVLQIELLLAFQLGLPSSILPGSHNTNVPANLHDSDFNESSTEMPPDRADTEETVIMFYIAKHRLSVAFEKVLQHVSTISNTEADTEFAIEALDAEIRQDYLALPDQYRAKAVSASCFDSATLVIARFCVNMMYEKSICVLHRPYVSTGRRESIAACKTASSNIVALVVDAYDEFGAGGQMEMQRWFMSAITWHDFLLGVTALCLVICSSCRYGLLTSSLVLELSPLLTRASALLDRHAMQSRDTDQVANIVRTVRSRLTTTSAPTFSRHPEQDFANQQNLVEQQAPKPPMTVVSSTTGTGTYTGNSGELAGTPDWAQNLWQPMTDESWIWMEQFLLNDGACLLDDNNL